MLGDRERPARIRSEQDRELARYLQRQVRAYSAHYRPMLQRAQQERAIRKRADLARLPLTSFDEVGDGRDLVLRPDYDTISRYGGLELGAKLLWARVIGRVERLGRTVVDPAYKPVLWIMEDGVPMGSSAADLERLSELGRRWLETAGVISSDVLVGILPPGPYLPFWELSLGARRGGLSSVFLEPSASSAAVARLQPSVLVGRPDDLARVLEDAHANGDVSRLQDLRTLVAAGEPLEPDVRARLRQLLPGRQSVDVVAAWAPLGVRSLWVECPGGTGLHTSPAVELLEVVDGEIVWTSLGWTGSVFVRLRTGVYGSVDETPCPSCGRTTPRVIVGSVDEAAVPSVAEPHSFAQALEDHPGVAAWQAELRTVNGTDELIVFLSPRGSDHPGPVLRELVEHMDVTQFVILDGETLERRLADHGGARVLDERVS